MKNPWHSKPTADRGYSLIEIMVTISIVAIVSVIGLPSLTRMFSVPPEGEELEQLRRALVETRNRTITADVCATIQVNGSELRSTVYRTCGPPLADPLDSRVYNFRRLIFSDFNIGDTLEFRPGGGTSLRQPATMQVQTTSNRLFELRVLPAIGNIRISERRQ